MARSLETHPQEPAVGVPCDPAGEAHAQASMDAILRGKPPPERDRDAENPLHGPGYADLVVGDAED